MSDRAPELGPLQLPYTYLPDYADVEYVDGKLQVARGILSRTTNADLRRRWLQTVDILLAQRSAIADLAHDDTVSARHWEEWKP